MITPETIGPIAGLSFSGVSGSTLATKSFTVINTSPISATFTAASNQLWLSIMSASRTTAPGNAVVVGVKTAGLAVGAYTAHITITIPNQNGYTWKNSPYAVPVTLTITAVAPTITTQPASVKIVAGHTATLMVAATGTSPMTYQWRKNGATIGGATSSSYTTAAETTADNSARFTVMVSNGAGSATSSAATLTVTAATYLLNSSVASLSFGSTNVSSGSTHSVTLTNAGNSSVSVSNVTISGAGFNATGISSGLILTPARTATLAVTFAPAAVGSVTGGVSIASNAANSPDSISLSGTGVAVVNHSVALSWSPSTSTVAGYNTYSSQQSGGPYTKLTGAPVATMSYTDTTVRAGLTYYYVVTSVDSNNVESGYSAQVSALVP